MLIPGPEGEQTLRLDEVVGAGAFGDVWKAVEVSSGVSFAVKFPRVLAIGTGDELTAFRNEVQAAGEIEHPNVVPVVYVEAAPADLPPYLVMEFVEGSTLRERLQQYRDANELVPLELVQTWAEGLVDGMAAINERMLHRDLRPENILMKGDTPLIGDFGLSKVVGAITRSETFKGAQHMLYMPPEGWKLESNDIQVDMYAMGIVLFEIATLEYPYELPSNVARIDALQDMHLFQQPRSPQDIRPELPVGFSHLVSRFMQKRPEERFPDWWEARRVMQEAWAGVEPTETSGSGRVTELLGEVQRVHEDRTRRQLEEQKQAAERAEQRRFDLVQMKNLVEELTGAVADFNQRSGLGKIEVEENLTNRHCRYQLPLAGSVTLGFDWIEPPLSLSRGKVRFYGLLKDEEGAGLNYLLCRKDESDLYGSWVVCRSTYSGAVDRRKVPARVEPFGFGGREMREIQVADQAMHVYQTEFERDLRDAFLQVALAALRRKHGS
jgi:NIMA (never in mitosis gene a)-related kinase/serine/threonine-protein kinase